MFPSQTLVFENERQTSEHKSDKERITIIICSNTIGSQSLKLVVIGKL